MIDDGLFRNVGKISKSRTARQPRAPAQPTWIASAGNAQSLLQLSLAEEERMAKWLKQNVEKVKLE